jgi:hypothetical protein
MKVKFKRIDAANLRISDLDVTFCTKPRLEHSTDYARQNCIPCRLNIGGMVTSCRQPKKILSFQPSFDLDQQCGRPKGLRMNIIPRNRQ